MRKELEQIKNIGILPVIKIDVAANAVPLAGALIDGGIHCAEITFRTDAAADALRMIHEVLPDILLGAGTVLTIEQAAIAKSAGAAFAVSPGFNSKVVDWCVANDLLIIPGCATPSDMEQAIERGLEAVKFFPAEQAGGIEYIRAVAAPYSTLHFLPTGGIGAHNLRNYLSFHKVIACGGSWMVKPELINAGQYEDVAHLCREAMRLVAEIRGGI